MSLPSASFLLSLQFVDRVLGKAASAFAVPAFGDYGFSLVCSVIQFVSHVFPPSTENAWRINLTF